MADTVADLTIAGILYMLFSVAYMLIVIGNVLHGHSNK